MQATLERADEVVGPASTSSAVSVLDPLKKIEAGLSALKSEAAALATVEPAGLDKAQRAFRLRCVKVRTDLDGAYEQVNRPMLETQRQARKLVADIKAAIEDMERPVDQAILAREREKEAERQRKVEAERLRIASIRDRLDAMGKVAPRAAGKPAADIASKIQFVVAIPLDDSWQEFKAEAERVHAETLATLRELHDAAVAQEAESARLADERRALERRQHFERKLQELRSLSVGMGNRSAEAVRLGLAALADVQVDPAAWAEFADQARAAKDAVTAELQHMLGAAEERERVARQQAEEAQRLAEQRQEQARKDAEAQAERQRADAAAAEARAAADRQAQQQRDAEAQRQREALAAEQRRIDEANAALAQRERDAAAALAAQAETKPPVPEPRDTLPETGTQPDEAPRIKLGELCARFGPGFTMTAAFVAALGVEGTQGDNGRNRAVMYTPLQVEAICTALATLAGKVRAGAWQREGSAA